MVTTVFVLFSISIIAIYCLYKFFSGHEFSRIYAIVGDSPLPLLVLAEGIECDSFIFFYTPEKSERISTLKRYFDSRYPKLSIEFDELPSMNDPSEQVVQIANKLALPKFKGKNSAVFVTAGTSTMAMSMWYHSQSRTWISLREGLELTISNPGATADVRTIVVDGRKFTRDQILFSRGWMYDGIKLRKGEEIESDLISVEFNPEEGKLLFFSRLPKGSEAKVGEKIVSSMSRLVHEFGHNGAEYEIHGNLSKRALNLMHNSVKFVEESEEE